MPFKEVMPVTLTDSVVEHIRGMILKQELKPGDGLPPERKLCELLGVSRTVIREANKRLAEMGIIEIKPGRGCHVRRLHKPFRRAMDFLVESGEATLTHLIEIRRVLETGAVTLAAQRARKCHIQQMEEALDQFSRSDGEKAVEGDQRFHMAIASATRNPLFPYVLDALNELLTGLQTRTLSTRKGKLLALDTHRGVLEAIKARDPHRARRLMACHLDHAETLLAAAPPARSGEVTQRSRRPTVPGKQPKDSI